MYKNKGFTMVELLVVLVIVAILAAVATPLYLANTKRSKMSEAISTTGLIRQALRDYKINRGSFFDIAEDTSKSNTSGNIQKGLPISVTNPTTTQVPNPDPSGVDVNVGVAQYFHNGAFFANADSVPATLTGISRSKLFTNPGPQDFLISVKGDNSYKCGANDTSCAVRAEEVAGYEAEMDNSGRIFVCYGTASAPCAPGGAVNNWGAY